MANVLTGLPEELVDEILSTHENLPEGYYFNRLGTDTHPSLVLCYRGKSLGTFIAYRKAENFKFVWRWSHGFRVAHYDSLEEGARICCARHRMGGTEDTERIVF